MSDHTIPTGGTPHDDEQWELVAGELAAAMHADRTRTSSAPADAMPAMLTERVVAAGEAMVSRGKASVSESVADSGAFVAPPVVAAVAAPIRRRVLTPKVLVRTLVVSSGWLAAAALFLFWIASPSRVGGTVTGAAALRDSILAADPAAASVRWTATTDAAAHSGVGVVAQGDVVWSTRAQRGVMRFAGLAPNNRRRWQYQLWIFDKRRDQRYPVDGGVFDIPANSRDVLVPINARLPVGEAVMFAITVEPAGGVVVSTRERIALLAKVGG